MDQPLWPMPLQAAPSVCWQTMETRCAAAAAVVCDAFVDVLSGGCGHHMWMPLEAAPSACWQMAETRCAAAAAKACAMLAQQLQEACRGVLGMLEPAAGGASDVGTRAAAGTYIACSDRCGVVVGRLLLAIPVKAMTSRGWDAAVHGCPTVRVNALGQLLHKGSAAATSAAAAAAACRPAPYTPCAIHGIARRVSCCSQPGLTNDDAAAAAVAACRTAPSTTST
jgi:hypothetical protein